MKAASSLLLCVLCVVSAACYEGLQRPLGVAEMQVPEPSRTPSDWRREAVVGERNRESLALYGRARNLDLAGRCPEAQEAYRDYASLVRPYDEGSADMAIAYARLCWSHAKIDPRIDQAADALSAHDYAKVLAITGGAAEGLDAAWLDLDRASAFVALRRTDDAVAAYRRAAVRFAQAADPPGRFQALWGEAHALDEAGRCSEATRAYEQYARFVRPSDPSAADRALAYAGACRPLVELR